MRCICATRLFLCGKTRKKWRRVAVVAFKNMFTSTTSLHKDFVTVVLGSFLVNCFEKIIMAANNSGLNSNYFLESEERRERERRKRHRVRINRRASGVPLKFCRFSQFCKTNYTHSIRASPGRSKAALSLHPEGGVGLLYISLGGGVQPGPSYSDPV